MAYNNSCNINQDSKAGEMVAQALNRLVTTTRGSGHGVCGQAHGRPATWTIPVGVVYKN